MPTSSSALETTKPTKTCSMHSTRILRQYAFPLLCLILIVFPQAYTVMIEKKLTSAKYYLERQSEVLKLLIYLNSPTTTK